ncbi:hypothetical protein HMPREF1624_03602 [Sporothrix schenckii ATCC 58251]|uniref:Uncharacterized protein n=1 Tax=Sporothrix schenckii (strain ATCC 58251 / de Perez 2211183) TaxID=1391915 RepID=U7Q0H6_SPOS1|nr:hypothetical protein HMPREF1624_03602 [Sporothrix schenckii ATCC 58251]
MAKAPRGKTIRLVLAEAIQDAINHQQDSVTESEAQKPNPEPAAAHTENGGLTWRHADGAARPKATGPSRLSKTSTNVVLPRENRVPDVNLKPKSQKAHERGNGSQPVGKPAENSVENLAEKPAITIKEEVQEHNHVPQSVRVPAAPEGKQDLFGALEAHLDGKPFTRTSAAREPPPPVHPLARVVYVDEYGREVVPRRADQRDLYRGGRDHPRDGERYGRYVAVESGEPYQRQARSPPANQGSYGPPSRAPTGQYWNRSPPLARRYADEPVYSGFPMGYEDAYERGALPGPHHHYARAQPRQEHYLDYADRAGRAEVAYRPADYDSYETYEVVQVTGPEGEYLVRRPVRREAPPAGQRGSGRHYPSSTVTPAPVPYDGVGGRDAGGIVRHDHTESYRGSGYGAQSESYGAGNLAYERRVVGEGPEAVSHHSVARSNPAYYDEYDPHNPSSGGAMQGAPSQIQYH